MGRRGLHGALSLDADALFRLLQTRPQVARRWFLSLAERMAGLQSRLTDLLAGGLEAQLASMLFRESENGPGVRLTQDQLAEMLGAARTSVQRGAAASGLRRLGVVMYLTAIAFGLGTIIEVLRFQAIRIGEVARQHGHHTKSTGRKTGI